MTGSKCTYRFPSLFLVLLPAIILFSQVPASAQVLQFDSLGTVTAKTIACPSQGLPATACYALDVSCPSISNYTVYLKTFVPASPRAVVTLTPGGTSTQLFEEHAYGSLSLHEP